MSLYNILQGTGVAIVTPFKSNAEVDLEALGRVIDFLINGGVEYIVSIGTTGESPTISHEEKIAIIQYTYEKVGGRVPVVVGAGGNNTAELVRELEELPLDRAVAVLSASPYYNKPSQEGLFQHYKAVASASPKPVILYNVPARTGRNINASTVIRLAHEVPNIAGIKEAGGDMVQSMQILRDRPKDFLVVSGDDALAFPQVACGMEGVISVAANAFPKEFSNMVRAALKGDLKKARQLNNMLMDSYDPMFAENNPAGVKAFLTELGLIANYIRLPNVPLSEGFYKKVKAYLSSIYHEQGAI
jgi:4-hydroxy-tetrahydrodipicolinate synthase